MRFVLFLGVLLGASVAIAQYDDAGWLHDADLALSTSQQLGKPIFLDAYTTWCAPCKQMDADVFSDPATTTLLHAWFVPLKLDMESPEAQALRQRYDIGVYPTLLVFDADGEWHRGVGFHDTKALFALAKLSLDSTQNWRSQQARYKAGERSDSLLLSLAAYAKTTQQQDEARYITDWLDVKDHWRSTAGRAAVFAAVPTAAHPLFDSLLADRTSYDQQFERFIVEERIVRLVEDALYGQAPASKRDAKRLLANVYPSRADSAYLRHQMRLAREAGKAKRYGKLALKWQRDWPTSDPDELAELLYVFESRLPGWKPAEVAQWRIREEELRSASDW